MQVKLRQGDQPEGSQDEIDSSGRDFYDRIHALLAAIGGVELVQPPSQKVPEASP
jgi:hypothetical protein